MSVKFESRDLAAKYNRFARWYDYFEGLCGLLGVSKLRHDLVSQANGKVLEVAIGTGRNLHCYRTDCEIIAVDISGEMLKVARERGAKLRVNVQLALADAEAMPFRERCFDTVVSSLSTCTFPNPSRALREMVRVTKLSGKILLLEHGRSDHQWLGRFQDRHADKIANLFGCHWNREPLEIAQATGLKIISARRNFFGIFHRIAAVLSV
jgi:ubiquinone/menaquinone biosynthesis C-methylase UbiE